MGQKKRNMFQDKLIFLPMLALSLTLFLYLRRLETPGVSAFVFVFSMILCQYMLMVRFLELTVACLD